MSRMVTVLSPCCNAEVTQVQKAIIYYETVAMLDENGKVSLMTGESQDMDYLGRASYECSACQQKLSPAVVRKAAKQALRELPKEDYLYEGFKRLAGLEEK